MIPKPDLDLTRERIHVRVTGGPFSACLLDALSGLFVIDGSLARGNHYGPAEYLVKNAAKLRSFEKLFRDLNGLLPN